MKHDRLKPIPGQHDPHIERLARHSSAAAMLVDASTALDFDALCDAIESAIEARPDIDPVLLRPFAHRMDRLSDRIERERKL